MAEKVLFFPLDVTYRIANNKASIYLFGKTQKNEQICVIDENFEPYFYAIPKKGQDIEEKLRKIRVERNEEISQVVKTEKVRRQYLGQDVDAIKIFTKLPKDVPIIREVIKDWELLEAVTEYDIPFKKRYLIDKSITPLELVEAQGEFINQRSRVPVLKATNIEQKGDTSLEKLKLLAFDIETYNPGGKNIEPEKNPIIMVAFYGDNYKKVITWKRFETKLDYIEFVDSEAALIEKIKETIGQFKPDIITGYFSDGFDLPYIKTRADKYKIKLDISLDFSELRVNRGKKTTSNLTGINHLDIYKFIRKIIGPSMDTFALNLNAVAAELINENKRDVDLDGLASIWDNNPEKLEPFCEYNLHDSYLTYRLAEKMLPNIIELVKIVGLTIPEVVRMGFSQLVESYLLKQAPRFNVIAPELPHNDELRKRMMQTYKGAFVFEPKPGLYTDIVVFDYRSLYPTIISSHNIDPGTLNCSCCESKATQAPTEGKTKFWFCSKKKGFLPSMIEDLITRRMRIKEIMKEKNSPLMEARSNSLKLLANSFYGYLGFSMARWYSLESAKATTAYGRFYIHKVIDEAQKEGFQVLYSDTDSVFLTFDGKTKDDVKKFQSKVNSELPGLMEMEYEGFYKRGIFVSVKIGKFGAKKKYALISEDGNMKIRGFETVRRNWSKIAKDIQEKVLDMILRENNKEKALKYVKSRIHDLRDNKIPVEEVIIHTQLTKEISAYDSIGPHVAIATRMREKGMQVGPGSLIEYVITRGEKKIRDKAKLPQEITQKDYDPDYYINSQVVPAVEKIFEVLGFSKEDLVESKSQKKLGKFF